MMVEYCNGGTLTKLLLNRQEKFTEKEAVDIIKQIIFGIAVIFLFMQEMHKNNIIHRDLKTQNIMFHNGVLKIVDLGFSKMIPGK